MVAEIRPAGDLNALGRDWRALEARGDASFFQSWSWIGTWLECLPADRRPEILTLRRAGEIAGLATFGRRTQRRHGLIAAHGLYLNETGDPAFDCLTVEYNGVLADREGAGDIVRAAVRHLVRGAGGWDELRLSGVPAAGAIDYAALAEGAGLSVRTLGHSDCRYVDLARIRSEGGTYLDRISSNTRYQVRRALRRYAARGTVALSVAANANEALARFDELKGLHQSAWTARGEPGSFANPFFETFHRALIARTAGTGETQLVRVAAGDATVGILYNFAWRGRIHAYQSGFAFESDNAMKPGLVAHALAVDHAIAAGADIYDFMAGEAQHKASLATDSLALAWLAARRPAAKYRIEDALRAAKRRLSGETRA